MGENEELSQFIFGALFRAGDSAYNYLLQLDGEGNPMVVG